MLYPLRCPKCGHEYKVLVPKPYEWETCPAGCGCSCEFDKFVVKGQKPKPNAL